MINPHVSRCCVFDEVQIGQVGNKWNTEDQDRNSFLNISIDRSLLWNKILLTKVKINKEEISNLSKYNKDNNCYNWTTNLEMWNN